MTEDFKKYVYDRLHTQPEDYLFDGKEMVRADREDAYRVMGIKYAETICHTCENKSACRFRSAGNEVVSDCNFYSEV